MMKIIYLSAMALLINCARSQAQNKDIPAPNDVATACKVLKILISYDLKNKSYQDILVTYLNYHHLNDLYEVPSDIKLYMNAFYNSNRKFIDPLCVSTTGQQSKQSSPKAEKTLEQNFKSPSTLIVEYGKNN